MSDRFDGKWSDEMIEELGAAPFDMDGATPDNWEGFRPCVKKPVVVHACQMNFREGFCITTANGVVKGKPGDYLVVALDGDAWPVAKEIFEKTYEYIDQTIIGKSDEADNA